MKTTRSHLVKTLTQLGLVPGDNVIVHTSFRSLHPVEGGANTLLDALLEVLGPQGNLMLPTFNYSHPLPDPHFDPAATQGRTGIVSELGRLRPEAMRSLHPTHSVAVIGPDARELTDGHLKGRAFGMGSPIDRLAERSGKVLLLGVGQTANSTIHIAEEHANIPKTPPRQPLAQVKIRLPDGTQISHQLDSSPSCSAAFEAAAWWLRQHDEIHDARIGTCLMQLMDGAAVIRRVYDALMQNTLALRCTNPLCVGCYTARQAKV